MDQRIKQDINSSFWFGHEMSDGKVLWHNEYADTDMGDLFTDELEQMLGPTESLTETLYNERLIEREVAVAMVKIKRQHGKAGLEIAFNKLTEYNERFGFK